MKFIRHITYLFYTYYLAGARKNVAYLSSILAVTFMVYMHLLIIALLFNAEKYLPALLDGPRGLRWLKLALLMSPVFIVLFYGVKEKKLVEMKDRYGYSNYEREFNQRVILVVYFVLSFLCLVLLAFLRKS